MLKELSSLCESPHNSIEVWKIRYEQKFFHEFNDLHRYWGDDVSGDGSHFHEQVDWCIMVQGDFGLNLSIKICV